MNYSNEIQHKGLVSGWHFVYLPTIKKPGKYDPLNYVFAGTKEFGQGFLTAITAIINAGAFRPDWHYGMHLSDARVIRNVIVSMTKDGYSPVQIVYFTDAMMKAGLNYYIIMFDQDDQANLWRLAGDQQLKLHSGESIISFLNQDNIVDNTPNYSKY